MVKMLRDQNAGLSRRFSLDQAFKFDDYSDSALNRILLQQIKDSGLTAARDVREKVIKELAMQRSRPNFGNAGAVVSMVAVARMRLLSRDPTATALTLSDFSLDKPVGDGRSALKGLCKVDHIITQLDELKAIIHQCELDGRDKTEYLQSYIFVGNPGTGKTTIARLMAESLHDMGLLSTNKLVRCSGLDMQGSYLGQTKDKVNELMADAQGGVLFIDEAYTLGSRDNRQNVFAQEALDQLVALMTESQHLHKTVVILAGYQKEMDDMIRRGNVGLQSRFTGRIEFPDWDAADCVQGILSLSTKQGIALSTSSTEILQREIEEIRLRPGWANARDSDTVFRFLNEARAMRCTQQAEVGAPQFTSDDIEQAAAKLRMQRPFAYIDDSASLATTETTLHPHQLPQPDLRQITDIREVWEEKKDSTSGGESAKLELEEIQVEPLSPSDQDIYAYLLKACVDAGYDLTHDSRQTLIGILEDVLAGGIFPDDILQPVLDQCGVGEATVMKVLRPQVHGVLEGMRHAVQAEEQRRQELERLAEQQRQAKQQEYERVQKRLRMSGLCPMGYSWHREGSGWRCAGGSHRVEDIAICGNVTT